MTTLSALVLASIEQELLQEDSGGDDWVTLHGVHVVLGDDGTIVKGPHRLIGKKPHEIGAKLPDDRKMSQKLKDAISHAAHDFGSALKGAWEKIATEKGREEVRDTARKLLSRDSAKKLATSITQKVGTEAVETKDMIKTFGKYLTGKEVKPEEKSAALYQLHDLATMALVLSLKGGVATGAMKILGKFGIAKGPIAKLIMKKVVAKASKAGLKKATGRSGILPSSFQSQHASASLTFGLGEESEESKTPEDLAIELMDLIIDEVVPEDIADENEIEDAIKQVGRSGDEGLKESVNDEELTCPECGEIPDQIRLVGDEIECGECGETSPASEWGDPEYTEA
jgi:predicted RNA-binding Zn-ribbon protein involved in translation (DUF1610 family)